MKLYKYGSASLLTWESKVEGEVLTITHGRFGGIKQEEKYRYGNNTYALREETSRVDAKIDRQGYSKAIPSTVPNMPMLASLYKHHQALPPFVFAQPKLDGMRCIATNTELVTRRNSFITSCPHIQEALKDLPDGVVLDGELYCHGMPFEEILSHCKRDIPSQIGLNRIDYHVFDIINEDDTEARLKELDKLSLPERVHKVRTKLISSGAVRKEWLACIDEGYEGLILRLPNAYYQKNVRSANLLKLKKLIMEEYQIIDITCASSGSEEGLAIFVMEKDGKQFKARPRIPFNERCSIYNDKSNFIGYWTRIEFPNYTVRGVPSKPIAVGLAKTKEGLN